MMTTMKITTLSKREMEIASLLSKGAQKWQIAEMLFISENTVANTVRNIYEKLQINTAVELTAWFIANKYLSEEMREHLKNEHSSLVKILPQSKAVSYAILRKNRNRNLNHLA